MIFTKRAHYVVLLVLTATVAVSVQCEAPEPAPPFTYQFLYFGDWMHNINGGITTGSGYLEMADLCLGYDLKAAGVPHGGSFFFKGAYTHGATPSLSMIGDFQVASNIEAGNHLYIQELWYDQPVGDFEFIAGLQDMNVLFAANQYSGAYLNSSFGVPPTISHNVPAPIFPLTSIGLTVLWKISDRLLWQAAVYDDCVKSFDTDPYNTKWHLRTNEGALTITEIQWTTSLANDMEGVYKLGLYDHTRLYALNEETGETELVYRDHYGFYVVADQMVAGKKGEPGNLALFARAGVSPRYESVNTFFVGGGINYYGLFKQDGGDLLGLGVACAMMKGTENETTFEGTYQFPLSSFLFIQPDIQYILQPIGTGEALGNSVVATVRIGVHF